MSEEFADETQQCQDYEEAPCYNPACDTLVEWPPGIRESYCSEECAKMARGGLTVRVEDKNGN